MISLIVLGLQTSIYGKDSNTLFIDSNNYKSSAFKEDRTIHFKVAKDGKYSIYTRGSSDTIITIRDSRGKEKESYRKGHGENGLIVMNLYRDEEYRLEIDNKNEENIYITHIQYGLPMSGYEPTYGDKDFNGRYQLYTNCYTYALNMLHKPDGNSFGYNGINPGYFNSKCFSIDNDVLSGSELLVRDRLEYACKLDGEKLGYEFRRIGKYEVASDGYYKVALFRRPDGGEYSPDYHWLRQDSNGLWSHKLGVLEATDRWKGEEIVVPDSIDFDEYNQFLGYYEVKNMDMNEY